MPTSGPGSRQPPPGRSAPSPFRGGADTSVSAGTPRPRGFTLLELLVVLAIVAVSAGLAVLALRDGGATRLEREAVRLAALLEMARAESRVSGTAVRWVPGAAGDAQAAPPGDGTPPVGFRFLGLSGQTRLPGHWLDGDVTASVPPPGFLVLGPEAILPAQRVVLRLGEQQIDLGSDGLGPFTVGAAPAGAAP